MKLINKSIFRSLFTLVLLFPAFATVCPATEIQARKFMATAGINAFRAASGDYRQLYGQTALMPEFKLTLLVYRNFSVWGGFGLASKQGFIEEVAEAAEIRQNIFSIGVGCAPKLSARLRLRGEVGLTYITFREEALQLVQEGSGLGWKIGADLDYFIGKKLFIFLAAAYSTASDNVETGKIDLGGLQAGMGLGFAF